MIVIAAEGWASAHLAARLAPFFPGRWAWSSFGLETCALFVAGAEWARDGDWVVAGRPADDPWGRPGRPLALAEAAHRYRRYGPMAAQLVAGPHVAIDVASGTAVRAMNGIVPVFTGNGNTGWFIGTSHASLAALSVDASALRPGMTCTAGGPTVSAGEAWSPAEKAVLDWASIDRELVTLNAGLALRPAALALGPGLSPSPEDQWVSAVSIDDELLFAPPLASRPGPEQWYLRVRHEDLPTLWWRGRLIHRWVHSPAFERPATDLAVLAVGVP